MERLGRVEDILEIQPVTSDNDPNGLLHRENGGYTACIYFTSTGIESAGDSPVSRGTDGGEAQWRCTVPCRTQKPGASI